VPVDLRLFIDRHLSLSGLKVMKLKVSTSCAHCKNQVPYTPFSTIALCILPQAPTRGLSTLFYIFLFYPLNPITFNITNPVRFMLIYQTKTPILASLSVFPLMYSAANHRSILTLIVLLSLVMEIML